MILNRHMLSSAVVWVYHQRHMRSLEITKKLKELEAKKSGVVTTERVRAADRFLTGIPTSMDGTPVAEEFIEISPNSSARG